MKKVVLILSILLLAGSSLIFASGNKESGTESEKPVTIEVWYSLSGKSGEAFKQRLHEFTADPAYADIKVVSSFSGNYGDTGTKVAAALMSGTEPHVIIGGNVAYTGGRGNFYAGEMVSSDPLFQKDDVFEGLWDYAVYENKICNIPYGISTPLMYYNKQIIEKAGLDLSTPPKTWDEFLVVAEKAQLNGNINNADEFWGFVVKDVPWLFKTQLSQNGNNVFEYVDDNYTVEAVFDDASAAEVAQWWADMAAAKVMPIGEHNNAENVFLAGNAAFFVGSSTKIADWSETMGDMLAAIPMPYFTYPSVALGGNTISIFPKKDQKQNDAAWTFVRYITSTEPNAKFALESGYMPIRKSAIELDIIQQAFQNMPMYKTGFEQLAHGWSYINTDNYIALDGAIRRTIEKMENGTADAQQAVIDAVKEFNIEAAD
ncbi:MAG: ABC transporter substrate-binding protein [Sphaerochaetaceae bacterium]